MFSDDAKKKAADHKTHGGLKVLKGMTSGRGPQILAAPRLRPGGAPQNREDTGNPAECETRGWCKCLSMCFSCIINANSLPVQTEEEEKIMCGKGVARTSF